MADSRDLEIGSLEAHIEIHKKVIIGLRASLKQEMAKDPADFIKIRDLKDQIALCKHKIKSWMEEMMRI
mgnify:CR=1 FL=1